MEGLVQVYYNNSWGTMCNEQRDKREADVVCRMMGYDGYSTVVVKSVDSYQQHYDAAWMTNLQCTGNESTLFSCNHDGWRLGKCVNGENAIVACKRSEGKNLNFLLASKIKLDDIMQHATAHER